MLSFRENVPLAPSLERWNIECDTGSNCMGSNQLDTQLKETWGLWAVRQVAWLNSGDVHWNDLACLLWQNCSFFSSELDGEWMSQGSWGGCSFYFPLAHTILSVSHGQRGHRMLNRICSADDTSMFTEMYQSNKRRRPWWTGLKSSKGCCIQYKTMVQTLVCVCVKGINMTNQNSQLKYD